jgi:hypothetical protein
MDVTADGIPLLRVGVKVGIMVVGIDAEDGEAGAAIRTAEAQQRHPRHPRGGAYLVATRKPRKEDAAAAASDLADAEAARAEDAALREAISKSLADLVPADNSMPMDAALAWSRQDWESSSGDC